MPDESTGRLPLPRKRRYVPRADDLGRSRPRGETSWHRRPEMIRPPFPSIRSQRVARGEVGRTLRSIRDSPREIAGIVVVALGLSPLVVGSVAGAFLLGEAIAEGTAADWPLATVARSGAGAVWLLATVASAFRTLATVGRLTEPDLALAVVPVGDLVVGKLLAEAGVLGCWFALPLVATAAAFAAGLGEPVAGLAVLVASFSIAAAALPAGFVVGITLKHLATRYEPIARVKTPLAVVLAAGYLAVLVSGRLQSLFVTLLEPLRYLPVSRVADLPLSVAVGEGSLPAAVAGAALTLLIGAAALAVAPRVAAVHWLSDPVTTSGGGGDPGTNAGFGRRTRFRAERLLAPVADRRTAAVAAVVWRRTVRSPIRLIYLLYPLFVLVEPARRTLESLAATGTVPLSIPPIAMAYLIWAGGMGFTLNPLGDQGATLPAALSVPGSARAVVRGRMLVGTLTTVPVASVAVGGLALASPLPLHGVGILVAATAVGVIAAVALATGIGAALPRFGSVSVSRNRRVVVPGKAAVSVYSTLVLSLSGSLALVAYEPAWEFLARVLSMLLSAPTPLSISVPVGHLRAAGTAVLAVLAVVPVLSYLYAVRRIAAYRLE